VQESPFAPKGFPPRFIGKGEIVEHYSKLPMVFESMRYPDLVVHQTTDPLVAIAEYRGDIQLRGSNVKYDNTYITLFRFDALGRIKLIREYFDPTVLKASDAFTKGGAPQLIKTDANAPTDDHLIWARTFFTTIDSGDVARIAERFTPDVKLRVGNAEAITGRDSVRASFEHTVASFRSVHHEVLGIWSGADGEHPVVSVEALVTYELKDSRRVSVPCTSTLRLEDDLVADYRIFIDVSPAFGVQTN
jgi:ketosteroid isomerase-like protein